MRRLRCQFEIVLGGSIEHEAGVYITIHVGDALQEISELQVRFLEYTFTLPNLIINFLAFDDHLQAFFLITSCSHITITAFLDFFTLSSSFLGGLCNPATKHRISPCQIIAHAVREIQVQSWDARRQDIV